MMIDSYSHTKTTLHYSVYSAVWPLGPDWLFSCDTVYCGQSFPMPFKASGLYNSLYYRTSRDRLDVRPSVCHTLALYENG